MTAEKLASPHKTPPALIVGAGPTGLVLALTLLQNGITVRIIEKVETQRIGQRGASILPRSLEVFGSLGILPQIEKQGHLSPPCCIYDSSGSPEPLHVFQLSPFVKPTSTTPNPNIILLGQEGLEQILRAEMSAYGVEIEYGHELVAFEEHENCVTAHIKSKNGVEKLVYEWLLGADGARGVVRKLLGCTFLGTSRNLENLFVGDIQIHNLDTRHWHMWGDAETTLVSLRPTEHKEKNLFSLLMVGKNVDMAAVTQSYDDLVKTFKETTNRHDINFGELEWFSNYRPNIRMVDTFGQRRVLIAGDAAHVHSPTGGQGINTGIQDSFNLGWKLALVHKKLAPISLLKSYDEERLPVIAEMLNQTTLLLERSFRGKGTLEEGQSAWHRGDNLDQLSVNYRWSSILVDETTTSDVTNVIDSYGVAPDGLLHAGDRAPDATDLAIVSTRPEYRNMYTRLFRLFSCSRHTALIFADTPEQYTPIVEHLASYRKNIVVPVVLLPENSSTVRRLTARRPSVGGGYDDTSSEGSDEGHTRRKTSDLLILEDEESHAYSAYSAKEKGLKIIIVRPDGVVGAIVHSAGGSEKYFSKLFDKDIQEAV